MASIQAHQNVIVNAYSVKETVEICSRTGVAKANMRIDKMFISSTLAGMLLAFACAASLSTQTAPWYQENAPGLIRMLGAVIFPFGLTLIVVTGADLCTGSFMFTTLSVLHGRLSVWKMLRHWVITFLGNLAGSLFIACLLMGEGGVFSTDPYKTQAVNFANKKVVTPMWHQIFLRGIGANWLVCLACFLAFMAREFFSKVAAIWWPTFAFVCLGLDHAIANMFFVPIAIFVGDGDISVGLYIWKSMIPTVIGNILGGGLFVAAAYWYLYITGDPKPIAVDGLYYNPEGIPILQSPYVPEESKRRESSTAGKSADNMV